MRVLQAALIEDIAADGAVLEVALTEACGAVEVRVSGPCADLRLLFDRSELQSAHVRHVVSETVRRYGASFRWPPHEKAHGRE